MTSELQLQQTLFPLDPWGCEGVFALVDHPHPAIARAIVGPLILGPDDHSGPQRLRCVALHSGRHFLYSAQVPPKLRFNPEKFWAMVASQFEAPDLRPMVDQSAPLAATPKDSVKHWSGSAFWMPEAVIGQQLHEAVHALSKLLARRDVDVSLCGGVFDPLRYEQLAAVRVNDQHIAATAHLIQAMVPDLRAAYAQRPRLSTSAVNRLLALAQADGALATKYMLQAIQTESFGLLHLMAFSDGASDAQEILQIVLGGGSLPTKFTELGISKGVHRRTLFRPENSTLQPPPQPLDISGLHIPGPQWLTAMRLTRRQPIYTLDDWHAFGHMLEQLQLLGLGDQLLISTVMACCVKNGYMECGAVLKGLCSNACALMEGAQLFSEVGLTFEAAICIAMEWIAHPPLTPVSHSHIGRLADWSEPATFILVVCKVFGLDVHDTIQSILNAHPGVPTGFSDPTGLLLLPLNSLALTMFHGYKAGNCLQHFHSLVDYLAKGVALYSVQDDGVTVGTIALKRDADEQDPKVEVLEISGRNNDRAGYQLGHLAQSLADKWNADGDNEVWIRFSAQCRRLSPV